MVPAALLSPFPVFDFPLFPSIMILFSGGSRLLAARSIVAYVLHVYGQKVFSIRVDVFRCDTYLLQLICVSRKMLGASTSF